LIDTANPIELLAAVQTIRTSRDFPQMRFTAREEVKHRSWDYINSQLMDHYLDVIASAELKKEVAA
jgi:phosphatidylinositol alpha 1,6-mannosyltransferase